MVHSPDSSSPISSSSLVTIEALRDTESGCLPDLLPVAASAFVRGDAWKTEPFGSKAAEKADVLAFGVECKGEFVLTEARSEFTSDCGPNENDELKDERCRLEPEGRFIEL